MSGEIDQGARDLAQSALAKLEGHEDVCSVRYAAIDATMQEIKAVMRAHARLYLAANGSVILFLAGIVAWLANRVF